MTRASERLSHCRCDGTLFIPPPASAASFWIFAKQRNDNLDLSGVAVIDPQLSLLPQIEANGLMHLSGFFPSVPTQVNFDLLFAPVNGQWRLFGISVFVGSMAPAAPEPPEPSQTVAQKQSKPPPVAPKQPAANGAR
jgi:hypothetical protein